jgi:hypothetical protein
MTWITTPTVAGPLSADNYNFAITGLSASTKYQYRAYFIVDGVEYYGNVLSGTTAAPTMISPSATTGTVFHIPLTTGFATHNNMVNSNGNAPIIEYGLLYTQNGAVGSGNFGYGDLHVKKTSIFSDVSIPYTYNMDATGLTPSTLTYFRAFAKNAIGVGYGSKDTQVTAEPPASIDVDVTISWDMPHQFGMNDGFGGLFTLNCCTGDVVHTETLPNYSKSCTLNWNFPSGCYYVDFSGLEARIDGAMVTWEISWMDSFDFGNSCCTNCFSTNNVITAELPLPPV